MSNHLEREAQHYWRHVKHLRLKSGLTADSNDTADELDVIRSMTENSIIRRDISRALADKQRLDRAQ
jgi:hypothetical protein